MSFILTLLNSPSFLAIPPTSTGRLIVGIGWLLFLFLNIALLWVWRKYNKPRDKGYWGKFSLLLLAVPLTSLFIGVRLPATGVLPTPGFPVEMIGPALMVFAAVPWILAGGLLGVIPASILAWLSGALLALWDTHNVFTPLEMALLAILFSVAVNQRYRTRLYMLLRHPFFTTIILSIIYPFIFLISASLAVDGTVAIRLDFALNQAGMRWLAIAGELLFAGILAEIVVIALPTAWGGHGVLHPSPSERSLQARFLYAIAPVVLFLIALLMMGDWIVVNQVSRQMLRERMANAAIIASESVPYFLGAGQNLILQLANDPQIREMDADRLSEVLLEDTRKVPFFTELYVLDSSSSSLAGYPDLDYSNSQASPEELVGVQRALDGVPSQYYSVTPNESDKAAKISFIAPIKDDDGTPVGVLVGRTDLSLNPFARPILGSLDSMTDEGGEGLLINDDGLILYHPDPDLLMEIFPVETPEESSFYLGTAPDGTRRFVYYQRALGSSWAVVMLIPVQRAQQLALGIATPLLVMVLVLTFVLFLIIWFGLGAVTRSLNDLSIQAGNLAEGDLDSVVPVEGVDEVGRLRRAFEQMRLSLKARLDEINQLLTVSQGVASSLEITKAIKPVLESALSTGASLARVALTTSSVPYPDEAKKMPLRFALGSHSEIYSYLDDQVLDLTRVQDSIVLNNLARARLIRIPPNSPRPHALMALALRHEDQYYGALWIAFDDPHIFSAEEIRFQTTLAGQAALAAANSYLFVNAEAGRQRLAAILASTPDPVLVIDQQGRLILSNPAAWQVLGLGVEWDEGQAIDRIITNDDLLSLLIGAEDDVQSAEVKLGDERVYYATATTVLAGRQQMGRVCVLRDVTYFKELDTLKSDFVATVSHDLRSPLTLMRGYATMLEMVGELNDQQLSYVRKIVGSVENMSRLVNNLLDLGRIEAGIDLQLELIALQDIVEGVLGSFQLQATQKRVGLTKNLPDQSFPLIEADQALLQQALHNLVENSIKYTNPGGQVTVRLFAQERQVIFEVSDTGIGIAPVDQPRLFEKFYRGAQQGEKPQRGSGLGLAIVKSIAERHGGRVWFESKLGKGSTFFFSIPVRQSSK